MNTAPFEIVERDEAGNVTSTYVESTGSEKHDGKQTTFRVDILLPKQSKSYAQQLLDVFLPAGYPQSVTEDYIQYQTYDSLQAFCSSIAGLLASRAVLEGVGVGDASASPTAALLLNVIQESMGRVATILFAHKLGTSLEPECKMYRLVADVFNDTAMILDCLSPAFPKPMRVLVLGFSSVLRSLCGVCAGSAKASLSAHFARNGNLGELNAKDSSQETVISLLGMLAGSLVVSHISSALATWTTLLFLLLVHLATNYFAVTAVSMRTLNRQRANIMLSTLLESNKVLTPRDVSKSERVFEKDGVLRWADDHIIGHCRIGVSMSEMLRALHGKKHEKTGALELRHVGLEELVAVYANEAYILWFASPTSQALIVLKENCSPTDQLRAWMHALLLAQRQRQRQRVRVGRKPQPPPDLNDESRAGLTELRATLEEVRRIFDKFEEDFVEAGWDLKVAALETRTGTRAMGSTIEQKYR